jgi:hypothetical protein
VDRGTVVRRLGWGGGVDWFWVGGMGRWVCNFGMVVAL